MKSIRQLEQIIRKDVWPEIVQHLRNDLCELSQSFRKSQLARSLQNEIRRLRRTASPARTFAGFTEDRADADIRVLQIRRGVALQREHLVPRKNVIGHSILHEIGVFHRADSDNPRNVNL